VLFERFDDKGLAQYSYAVGCEGAGEMAIVDPRRDVDVYLRFAAERRMRIAHVLETHIHADFASGARELAERAGVQLHLSAYDAGEVYETSFPHRELHDGDSVQVEVVSAHRGNEPATFGRRSLQRGCIERRNLLPTIGIHRQSSAALALRPRRGPHSVGPMSCASR